MFVKLCKKNYPYRFIIENQQESIAVLNKLMLKYLEKMEEGGKELMEMKDKIHEINQKTLLLEGKN